jgi:hypothetical protein
LRICHRHSTWDPRLGILYQNSKFKKNNSQVESSQAYSGL